MSLSIAFTRPTFQRILPLIVGAILTLGRRTVTGVLRTLHGLAPGNSSTYHRVFSRAVWSLWPLGKVLATAILRLIPQDQPVLVPMDDTTTQHRGKKVYGKGRHHDAVRSTHTHVVWRWGHRWVVLAISVKFPFTSRRWALPVLAALYRPKELNLSEGHRHKTAPDLARQMMAVLIHWFPERRFVFLGDGGYASHELARSCHRHRTHATLVSRFHGDANLYAAPPQHKARQGRPRLKGAKLPTPQEVVRRTRRTKATVSWYGGGQRRLEWVSGTAYWYMAGHGLVPIRWVFVHDLQGTHRDEYFYTTDPTLSPEQVISFFTARWPIETTFQEVRAHLGFETTRQRVARSVLRTAPCLLGMYSLICLIFAEHVGRHRVRPAATSWYRKQELTFADAMVTVRRLLWEHSVFEKPPDHDAFDKLPARLRHLLLDQLSRAA
ncbi:MAG TPA: transposase [Phycisphaerae bacterium]|nr:transposase [Phycisphaerae bacterium]